MIKRGAEIAGAFRKLVPPYEPFHRFPVLQKPDPKPDLLLTSNPSRDREKDTREIDRTLSIAAIGNRRLPSWTIGPSPSLLPSLLGYELPTHTDADLCRLPTPVRCRPPAGIVDLPSLPLVDLPLGSSFADSFTRSPSSFADYRLLPSRLQNWI
ncbi:hypothetical protein LXL04_018222 [Taraxacum kok-saghyz]